MIVHLVLVFIYLLQIIFLTLDLLTYLVPSYSLIKEPKFVEVYNKCISCVAKRSGLCHG